MGLGGFQAVHLIPLRLTFHICKVATGMFQKLTEMLTGSQQSALLQQAFVSGRSPSLHRMSGALPAGGRVEPKQNFLRVGIFPVQHNDELRNVPLRAHLVCLFVKVRILQSV